MRNRLRIVVADDHLLLVEAFQRIIEPAFKVVAKVTDGLALLDAVRTHEPDLALVDIAMPGMNGLDACEAIYRDWPRVRVIVLTGDASADVAAEAFRVGAWAFIVKSASPVELLDGLRAVAEGKKYLSRAIVGGDLGQLPLGMALPRWRDLSPREQEVAERVARGQTAKEIAADLSIGSRTVELHKYQAMKVFGVKTTSEFVQAVLKWKPP